MSARHEYPTRAARLFANAEAELDSALKDKFENLARSYLRLVEQAKRNGEIGVAWAPPKGRVVNRARMRVPVPC